MPIFVDLANKYFHYKKIESFLKDRLGHMPALLTASRSSCETLRKANKDLLRTWTTDR